MTLDLDSILAVADGYDERKKKAGAWHVQNDIDADAEHLARLATFKTGEAVKAFEALRPLVERVRELERQRMLFARFVEMYRVPYCVGCPAFNEPCHRPETSYRRTPQECIQNLIQWAESAAKQE